MALIDFFVKLVGIKKKILLFGAQCRTYSLPLWTTPLKNLECALVGFKCKSPRSLTNNSGSEPKAAGDGVGEQKINAKIASNGTDDSLSANNNLFFTKNILAGK